MGYCGFYEPGGLHYWCNKENRDVGWTIWNEYCKKDGNGCPYLTDSKGCFLTTACVESKNLPDDCKELQVLRSFRDSFLMQQPQGEQDVEEYYHMAPKIVAVINKLPNSRKIYEDIYENIILVCVKLIENGKYNEAYETYKSAMLRLKETYK